MRIALLLLLAIAARAQTIINIIPNATASGEVRFWGVGSPVRYVGVSGAVTIPTTYRISWPSAAPATGDCLTAAAIVSGIRPMAWGPCTGGALLSSNNTWTGTNTYSAGVTFNGAFTVSTLAGVFQAGLYSATNIDYGSVLSTGGITVLNSTSDAFLRNLTITGTCTGCGSGSLPVVDTTAVVKGSVDATKLLRFGVGGLTTATTRVLTPQDANYTIAGKDLDNVFSTNQTFKDVLCYTNIGCNIGATATRFNTLFTTNIEAAPAGVAGAYTNTRHLTVADQAGGTAYWDFLVNASVNSSMTIRDSAGRSSLTLYSSLVSVPYYAAVLDGGFFPATTLTYDTGSSSARWRKLWVGDIDVSGTCTGCMNLSGDVGINTTYFTPLHQPLGGNGLAIRGISDRGNLDFQTAKAGTLAAGDNIGAFSWTNTDNTYSDTDLRVGLLRMQLEGVTSGRLGSRFQFYTRSDNQALLVTERMRIASDGLVTVYGSFVANGTLNGATSLDFGTTFSRLGTTIVDGSRNGFLNDVTLTGNLTAFRAANDQVVKANKLVTNYQNTAASFQFLMSTTNTFDLLDNSGVLMQRWDSSIASIGVAGGFTPIGTSLTRPLGGSLARWSKLWVGDVDASGNATIGGNLTISGTCTGCGSTEVSIMNYGGNNTGTASNDTAYASAVAALPASGGCVFFPSGTFLFSDSVDLGNGNSSAQSTIQNPCVRGAGVGATVISRTSNSSCAAQKSISSISVGTPATLTTTISHGMYTGQLVSLTSASGLTIPSGVFINNLEVEVTGINTFTLRTLFGTPIAGTGAYGGGSFSLSQAPGACAVMAVRGPVNNARIEGVTLDAGGIISNGLDVAHGNHATFRNITVQNASNKGMYFTGNTTVATSGTVYGACLSHGEHLTVTTPSGSAASGIWMDGMRVPPYYFDVCSSSFTNLFAQYSGGPGTYGFFFGVVDSVIMDMIGGFSVGTGGSDYYFSNFADGWPANIQLKHVVVSVNGFGGAAGTNGTPNYSTVEVAPYVNENCSGSIGSKCDPGSIVGVSGVDYSGHRTGTSARITRPYTNSTGVGFGPYKDDMTLLLESSGGRGSAGEGPSLGFGNSTDFNYAVLKASSTNGTACNVGAGTNCGGYLGFWTMASNTGMAERMRLDETGNLTLGTGSMTVNTSAAYNSIQSILGGAYVKLGYTADQAFYSKDYASSASLNSPASGYGGFGHKSGSQYWYWNGAGWGSVDFAAAAGVASVTASSPIVSSGGVNPNITCTSCITTAGGQTINGSLTLSGFGSTLTTGSSVISGGSITSNTGYFISGAGDYFDSSGNGGLTTTKTIRNSAGTGTCTLIYGSGLLIGGTC